MNHANWRDGVAGPMRAAAKAYDVPFIEQQVAGLGCESELYQTGGSDVGADLVAMWIGWVCVSGAEVDLLRT